MSREQQTSHKVEIVGPPGAGKTSLLSVLVESQPELEPIHEWRQLRFYPSFASNAIGLLPFFLFQWMARQPLSRRDMERMIRLHASRTITENLEDEIVVLDQGPIYTLATLHLSASRPTNSSSFENRWKQVAQRWAGLLDTVVFLEAPGDVLLQRILDRSKPHFLKSQTGVDKLEWLNVLSATLKRTVDIFQEHSGLTVLRFDTSKEQLPDILARVQKELARPPRSDRS
jgi:deoxyadenosine/deoxycytidine kinase